MLGKEAVKKHSVKKFFVKCKKNTRQKSYKKHSTKKFFCRVSKKTQQRASLLSVFFPSVFFALGPKKTLDKPLGTQQRAEFR
jgi:hypothetical protein